MLWTLPFFHQNKYIMSWFIFPDNSVHGVNMRSTWVLSAPDGPHVGPMNLAIGVPFLPLYTQVSTWPCPSYTVVPVTSCGIWYTGKSQPPRPDDVIKWKHFPRYWPFVRGIHRLPVNSPHKDQWRGALVFSFMNGWVNNREAGDLRRHDTHYDVTVMEDSSQMTHNDARYNKHG